MKISSFPQKFLRVDFTCSKNVVNEIPTAILAQDQSKLSRNLARMFDDSERFDVVAEFSTEEDLRNAVDSGRVKIAIEIPKHFSRDIRQGIGSEVLIVVNSANNMFSNPAISSSQEIVRTFSAMLGKSQIRLGTRILGNPVNGYSSFMLSGLILNGAQIGLMISFAAFFFDESRSNGRIRDLPWKILPYWIFSLTGFMIAIWISTKLFAIPMHGSWIDIAKIGGGFLYFVIGVLSLFSILSPQREMCLQAPMIYIMPGLLFSGLSFPRFDMNSFGAIFSTILPMTYAGESIRDAMLMGSSPEISSMILGGSIPLAISILVFWRRVQCSRENFETV